MSENTGLIKNKPRKTLSLNITEEQVEYLRAIKKATNIPLARIAEQLLEEPLKKAYKKCRS